MAYQVNDFGATEKAAGLLIPNIPNTIVSFILQDDVDLEGGFPVYGYKGQDKKCYKTHVTSNVAVAAVWNITPSVDTAATGTIKVTRNGVVVAEITTTADSTVKTVVEALKAEFDNDTLYTVTEDDTKLIATAKVAGANRNDDVWEIDPGTSGFTFATPTLATTGEDTVIGSVLLGFVKRESCKDSFKAGDVVNVVMKGGMQLKAGEAIDSYSALYVETTGNTVVDTAGSNVNANAISLTSAANGGLFDALIG
jgi:hypothetical protein